MDSPQSSPSSGSQDSLHRHPAGTGTYPGPGTSAAAAAAAAAAKKKSRFGTLGRIFKKGDSRAGPQMKLMHPGMAAMQAYPRFHSPSPIPTQGELRQKKAQGSQVLIFSRMLLKRLVLRSHGS